MAKRARTRSVPLADLLHAEPMLLGLLAPHGGVATAEQKGRVWYRRNGQPSCMEVRQRASGAPGPVVAITTLRYR